MPELSIGLVALPPLIVAVVELVKQLGLPSKYAPWLNGILTVIGYVLVRWGERQPELVPQIESVLIGIVVFLTAAGLYDRGQATVKWLTK